MDSTEGLKRKIRTTEDLQSVVKTMKALAAMNMRQYEKAVESLADYNRTIDLGLHIALNMKPEGAVIVQPAFTRRLGAIVFGSDQGMCGQLNEQIVDHVIQAMEGFGIEREHQALLAVGLRVGYHLEDAGQSVEECLSVPSSKAGVTLMAQDLLVKIEEWQAREGFDRIMLFYQKLSSGYSYTPQTVRLLPIDLEGLNRVEQTTWPSRVLPIFTMEWDQLFSLLIRQYLFVALCRALTESLASENASRLASMQGAERNIGEHLEELQGQFHQQRQMTITEELLDIVGGFEALKGSRR